MSNITRHYCGLPILPDHLARFYVDAGGCWIWTGAINSYGYGAVHSRGNVRGAHREIYLELAGPIPAGLDLDHLCHVKACVNPDHLEPVSKGENSLRSPTTVNSINLAKTHCHRGHEFTEENTYLWHGHRHCRACARMYAQ